jgi:transcriptional regulator with XRE-family HTH domain
MNLGEKLRLLRKSTRELTLVEVAEKTGLSVSFLSDLERGQTRPSLDTLEKLSNFFGVNVNELIETNLNDNKDRKLPAGLKELLDEEKIADDILDLMLTAEQRSKKRPKTKDDWLKYYYSFKILLGR